MIDRSSFGCKLPISLSRLSDNSCRSCSVGMSRRRSSSVALLRVERLIICEGDFDAVGVNEQAVADAELDLGVEILFVGENTEQPALGFEIQNSSIGSRQQRPGMAGRQSGT